MRFKQQSVFVYDAGHFGSASIHDLLNITDASRTSFPMGGLSDFREVFAILREYYSNFPILEFRELRTDDAIIDPLWNEPSALKLEFTRAIAMPCVISLGEQRVKRGKTGPEKTYDLRVHAGLPILFDTDYWPSPGDEFSFRGIVHSVSHVHVLPTDYFQQSALPTHVTIDATIKQYDGMVPHQDNRAATSGLEESGRAARPATVDDPGQDLVSSPGDDSWL